MIFATFRTITILIFKFIGLLAFCRSKKRKAVAIKNINLCFPIRNNNDKKRNKKILKGSFVSLGQTFADFLLLRFYTKKNIDKYVNFKNLDYFDQAQNLGKGVIISTAHFGSWELAAHSFAMKGFKSLVLYNPLRKPIFLEKFIKKNREYSGNVLVAKQNSLLSVYRRLKQKGIVSFLSDQNCLPIDGRKAPFFGYNVWSHSAFIKLSLKTGAPIVLGFIFAKSLFKYEVKVFPPLYPKDFMHFDDPEYEMLCRHNQILQEAICISPSHWMWQHRRFKNLNI